MPPFARAIRIAAILSAFVIATAILTNLRFGYQTDFVSFWAAAKLVLSGHPADAYNIALHKSVELSAVALNGLMPFPYPPPYFWVVLPFGLLPYAAAHAAWVGMTLSAYIASARRLVPGSALLALAFPPVVICGIIGQNSFLLAAIFMAGLALLKPRPMLAGMVFGCMIFKPHLGILLPLALVAGREWRAFAGATMSTLGLMLGSLMMFGIASWKGFFALLPLYGNIAADGLVSWNKMASVYASLRLIGVPETLAWGMHAVVALIACAGLWRVWRSSDDGLARGAALASATLLISPYIYIYDQMLLFVGIACLWQRGGHEKWLGAIFAISILSLAGNFYAATVVNLAPLATIITLALVMRLSVPIAAHLHRHDRQIAQNYR